jgi:hypothetical protein
MPNRPLNSITIIDHPNDPNNINTLPKKERPKELWVFVGRIGYEKFSDEPDAPMGKGFLVKGFSRVHWDWLRTQKVEWFLQNSDKYELDAHAWLEGEYEYCEKIRKFMLQQLNLDSNKYYVMTWITDAFKPMPKLQEIKP